MTSSVRVLSKRKTFLSIVLGTIGLACVLGICVDIVTAHVAVEYFTVHHPRIIASDQPIVLAFVWGIAASWWFGAITGTIAAAINSGRQHPLSAKRILRWVAVACASIWTIMMLIVFAIMQISSYIPLEKRRETFESDRRLVAVAMAHQYEYAFGGIALLIIGIAIWRAGRT